MRRASFVVISLASLAACGPSPTEAKRMLESTDPTKRQDGAAALRKMYAKDPLSVGDHGESYWASRCARARGEKASAAAEILDHPQVSGGEAGGGGVNETYRLDPFWMTNVGRSTRGDDTIFAIEPPRRVVVHIDVPVPANFTGAWTTYYVNGAVYETVDSEGGVHRRDRVFHEDGTVKQEAHYVDGKLAD